MLFRRVKFNLISKKTDDVELKVGDCQNPDFFSVTCDFEDLNICGYKDDNTAKFKWTRNKGATPTSNTGPSFDNTYETSSGYYMYIEVTPQKPGL